MQEIFDRKQVAHRRARATANSSDAFFLFDWAMGQIEDRLSLVRREFPSCVQIGARGQRISKGPFGIDHLFTSDIFTPTGTTTGADIVCTEEFFPFRASSLDLVVSPLCLHTVNDLPGALLQIRRSLKPDGLFLAAMLGGETLYELRQCLAEAEVEILGGLSPRIAPFADKPQAGALLQRAGFALPVIDSEIVTVTYDSIFPLMMDLRRMGESNTVKERRKSFTPRALFPRAAELYAEKFSESDGRIRASFEVIFMLGWAPHESQQKALKPGSADVRLADFLGTVETAAGEKPH